MIQTQVCVRTASGADAEAVRAFLAGLSPNAQYQRFFTGLGSVSPSLVRELVSVTPRRRNVIALCGAEVVGHGMAVVDAASTVELGVVVADAHLRQGIATNLVRVLLEQAVRAGADRVRMDVLTENRTVLEWIRRSLPDLEFQREGYTLTAHAPLSPAMITAPAA